MLAYPVNMLEWYSATTCVIGCHIWVYYLKLSMWHADIPFQVSLVIASLKSHDAMVFIPGAAGGQNPRTYAYDSLKSRSKKSCENHFRVARSIFNVSG